MKVINTTKYTTEKMSIYTKYGDLYMSKLIEDNGLDFETYKEYVCFSQNITYNKAISAENKICIELTFLPLDKNDYEFEYVTIYVGTNELAELINLR